MASAAHYEQEVRRIVHALGTAGQIEVRWNSLAEARVHKRTVAQVQKDLRLLKKQIALEIKTASAQFTSQRTMVGKGIGGGLVAGLFGRKAAGHLNAVRRESLRADQERAVAPYRAVGAMIDRILAQLDGLKLDIDRKLLASE